MTNIEVILNGKPVYVPEEMTISHFQKIQKEPEFFQKNPHALLAVYLNVKLNELKDAPKADVDFVSNYIASNLTPPNDEELVLTFTYNGVEYGLENNWGQLAFGAWIDFEVYTAENSIDNIHRIMSILYRPIVSKDKKDPKKYTIEPYISEQVEERAQMFLDLPVKYWIGAAGFFFQIAELYITNINNSLKWKNKVNRLAMMGWKKLPKFLQRKLPLGSILLSYTNSQKKMLQK